MKKEKCGQGRPNCEECPLASYWLGEGLFPRSPLCLKDRPLVIGDALLRRCAARLLTGQKGRAAEVIHTLGYTNVIACRWPKDKPKEFLAQLHIPTRRGKRLLLSLLRRSISPASRGE